MDRRRGAKTSARVAEALEAYRFNDAAGALYQFTWGTFCDWYLEFTKPILNGDDAAAKAETRATTGWVLEEILPAATHALSSPKSFGKSSAPTAKAA